MHRYVLEKRIGEGGMAEVFRARTEGAAGFSRRCAVKRLLPDLAHDRALQARFVDEARIASRLEHNRIVAVTDFYEENGVHHLVMEFVDGVSVEHLVQRGLAGRFLPPAIAARIVADVARAVEYAHGESVLHRDISACNVLVSRTGDVKLADFGLADARERISSTDPGGLAGKLEYLSPERRRGEKPTKQDDVYAVGVLLERMLDAMDPRDRAQADGQRLAAIRARLSAPLASRIPSATALVAELRGITKADDDTIGAFVQRNPQAHAQPAPAPRLSADELDETTASGVDADEETTEDGASALSVSITVPEAYPLAHLAAADDDHTHIDPPRPARSRRRVRRTLIVALVLAALAIVGWVTLRPTSTDMRAQAATPAP